MGLNIKNLEVERLASEVAALTGESKTEAIRRALLDRKESLQKTVRLRTEGIQEWLKQSIWPSTKPEFQGKPVSKAEMDALWE